jgi:hypothetical protein
MPRYVILEHDFPVRHWDLMLQAGEVLRTWKLTSPPQIGLTVAAEKSFDHRPIYLDYEGPISGGRGAVVRWDGGSYQPITEENDRIVVRLKGTRLNGEAILARDSDGQWHVRFQQSDNES